MKRRTLALITHLVNISFSSLGICCVIFELSSFWRMIVVAIAPINISLLLRMSRCPSCGRFTLGIKPFSHGAIHCKRCGQPVDNDRPLEK